MTTRLLTLIVAIVLVAAAAGPARAAERGAIAVLPLTASERRLELYGRPVASALAAGLGRATGARATVLHGSVPSDIAWVIDGRIVARPRGEIVLEARLRDPGRGSAAGVVASGAGPLTEIDRLSDELVGQLVTLYLAAEADRRPGGRRRLPTTVIAGRPAVVDPGARPSRTRHLIGRLGGQVAGGAVDAAGAAGADLARLGERLGDAVSAEELAGVVDAAQAARSLAAANADLAVLVELVAIDFSWRGVLSARGAVRFVVVDRLGKVRLDTIARTDTVVGSRGDRHAALLHFVVEQAIDVAWPRLVRVMR